MVDPKRDKEQTEADDMPELETVTQLTLEEISDESMEDLGGIVTAEELEQDSVIINPDPESMEARG